MKLRCDNHSDNANNVAKALNILKTKTVVKDKPKVVATLLLVMTTANYCHDTCSEADQGDIPNGSRIQSG